MLVILDSYRLFYQTGYSNSQTAKSNIWIITYENNQMHKLL